jgi:hypothetical protein
MQFNAGVSTAATLGDQNIEFALPGTLRLFDPVDFYGEISGFGTGDRIQLAGGWAFSAISHAGGMTTLSLASNGTTHDFEFVGDYAQSNFSFRTNQHGVTVIRFA